MDKNVKAFMSVVESRNPGEKEFLQAVYEVAEAVIPYIEEHPQYKSTKIIPLTEFEELF